MGWRRCDGALLSHVDDMTPGLVALVAVGEEVHVTAEGRRDFGAARMERDTIFRIASMTKPVAAAAAMILVEDGRLALDEPVGRLLPELARPRVLARLDGPIDETVPAARPIRVEDLMTMRLGIGAIMAPGEFPINTAMAERGIGRRDRGLPEVDGMDGYAAALGSLPLMRQPGDYWLYDTGMDLLGVLIERAAGQPLARFMAERIFAPLGMADTGFSVPAAKLDRLAACYWRNIASGEFERFDGEGEESRFARPPRFASAAGGLVSTADDYLAFARMMLGGRGASRAADSVGGLGPGDADRPHSGRGEGAFAVRAGLLGGGRLGPRHAGGDAVRARPAGRVRLGGRPRHQRLLGPGERACGHPPDPAGDGQPGADGGLHRLLDPRPGGGGSMKEGFRTRDTK